MNYPSISVCIPTLNAERFLEKCLQSIINQDYPKDKIEIIIADGGSTDQTLTIARKYNTKIFDNPLKTAEAGKAVAFKQANNELIALIDSDNLLPDKNWLQKMVKPFSETEIIGSEPWEFTYRKTDGFIDRYMALLGMNDPICYFLGNYDKLCTLSGKWTGLNIKTEDQGDWLLIKLRTPNIPTIGANGTILRKSILTNYQNIKYLFDIDLLADLANKKSLKFAKVKTGILHLYCGNSISKYIRKQKRRISDYLYFQKIKARSYPWTSHHQKGLILFIISTITFIPLIIQSLIGFYKKPDLAWFFHPLACILNLFINVKETLLTKVSAPQINRNKWQQ